MADKKISALTGASTPLVGTEVLPIVQSGATVKVAVSDLTAGRAISATQLTLSAGNVIVANGYGVDFSATPGTGTSELLADYEEGTFTATLTPSTSGSITLGTNNTLAYTKTGRVVTITGAITVSSVSLPVGTLIKLETLPFAIADLTNLAGRFGGACGIFTTIAGDITAPIYSVEATNYMYFVTTAANIQATTTFYVGFSYFAA
jgi:hypothetical protein